MKLFKIIFRESKKHDPVIHYWTAASFEAVSKEAERSAYEYDTEVVLVKYIVEVYKHVEDDSKTKLSEVKK